MPMISHAQGSDELDALFDALQEGSFAVNLSEITANSVTLSFPVQKQNNQNLTNYKVILENKSMLEADLATASGTIYTGVTISNDTVTIKLTNLDPTKKYYTSVIALDANNVAIPELFSSEINFNINEEMGGTPAPAPTTQTETHNAGGSDMSQAVANISYVQNGNQVRVTWTPNGNAISVDASLRHSSETTFREVGRVPIGQANLTFTVDKGGTYTLWLRPLDSNGQLNGVEFRQQIELQPVTAPAPTPTTGNRIVITDKTGPTENTLLLIAFTAVGYMIYRRRLLKIK
jgi:hypothetical protein